MQQVCLQNCQPYQKYAIYACILETIIIKIIQYYLFIIGNYAYVIPLDIIFSNYITYTICKNIYAHLNIAREKIYYIAAKTTIPNYFYILISFICFMKYNITFPNDIILFIIYMSYTFDSLFTVIIMQLYETERIRYSTILYNQVTQV